MRSFYLGLMASILFTTAAWAQNIITIPGDTSAVTGVVTDEFDPLDVHLEVVNPMAQDITFTWMMKNYSTPSGVWEVKLCDNNNCYDLLLNAGPYESLTVAAGDTMDFKFQFSPHCVNGAGDADVLVYVTGDSANTAKSLHFTANITTTCVNAISAVNKLNINLFPNPVKGSFVVTGLDNVGNLSFEVYDLKGKLVKSKVTGASADQIEISVENLTQGTYLLKVSDESGKIIATARLNKVN